MTLDATNALRFSTDTALAAPSIIGITPYVVNLVVVNNAAINFDDVSNRSRTTTRLTVGAYYDGYLSYAAGDGYLNPIVENLSDKNVVLSQQSLTDMTWKLGPLVFPYTLNGVSGGTDMNSFFPPLGSNNNTQVYVQLLGPGLNPNTGNYFKATKSILNTGIHVSYYIMLENAGVVIP